MSGFRALSPPYRYGGMPLRRKRTNGVGANGDPHVANVVSLLHFDGADGSTTFTDVTGKTWTPAGNAQIDTAQSIYGGASGLFDGTGDYLTAANSIDFDFGTGDFTIECFARFSSTSSVMTLMSNYQNSSAGWSFQRRSDSGNFSFRHGNTTLIGNAFSPTTGVWYHMAVCRHGTNLRQFIDGMQIGSTVTDSTNISSSVSPLFVGALNSGLQYFDGHLDEVRITKGVARYVANFTPIVPHPNF